MNRPALEVADVVRQYGAAYLARYGSTLSPEQHRALRAIAVCRTAALGGMRRSVTSVATWRSPLTPVAIGIAPRVQAGRKPPGSPPAKRSCSTSPTSMWCLPSHIS